MKSKFVKLTTLVAFSTLAGLTIAGTNVKADTTTTTNNVAVTQTAPANVELYSNSLAQVNNVQRVNFPSGYTLNALRNVNANNNSSFDAIAKQGMSMNNYQSNAQAASESVNIDNLSDSQTTEINQYALGLINNARAEMGQPAFTQNQGTINAVKNMALQYQAKNETLFNGSGHDQSILHGDSENIAAQQIYADNIAGLSSVPFAQVRGSQLLNMNQMPLTTVSNMDDLRALVYYNIMGLFFNDAGSQYGHAKNFLTNYQVINNLAMYPSILNGTGHGTTWTNGQASPFSFKIKNIDLHFIWTNGTGSTNNNSGSTTNNTNHNNSQSNNNTANTNNHSNASGQTTVDNGNYGWLDSINLNNNGAVTVSGWHATNQANGRAYHYIIFLDQNNRELGRVNVTNHALQRNDVQRDYRNVANADHSGFSATLNLGSRLANVTTVKVLSRYTTDPAGNGNYVDYWYNNKSLAVDQSNNAWFDGAKVVGNQLELTGWHATNQSASRPYHYIIVLVNGKEVARQRVTPATRNDVARVYPHIYNAQNSGFDVKFDLSQINFNQHVQFLSRYTDDPAGNGNYVDRWFDLSANPANQGWLDNFTVSGSRLNISGWHATDASKFETHHYIILWDATAKRQVGSWNAATVSRSDVARVYPRIANSGKSGFNLSLDLSHLNLVAGHTYQVVSRYSSAATGNGNGNGQQYTDYWFAGKVLKH